MSTPGDEEFDLKDYAKVAAVLWAVQANGGPAYTWRIVKSVMSALSEAGVEKVPHNIAFLDTSLRDIDFGKQINARVHYLKREGVHIKTVRDLVNLTERDIMMAPNVGRSTVNSIKSVLAAHGLRLGMDR